jgi:hypothetical protein
MLATILGKRWKWERVRGLKHDGKRVDGLCDAPTKPGKAIQIDASLSGERELAVSLHEMAHAAGWHIDEEFVDRFSEDAARVLTKLGWRKALQDQHDQRS